MSTTKDIRTRDEIIVTVGKRDDRNANADVNRRRRGAPQTSKPNDGILHRRKKRDRGINFYDLGYQKQPNGSFQTVDFGIVPPLITSGSSRFDAEAHVRQVEIADYTDVRDPAVFDPIGAPSTWKDKVKKITKGPVADRLRYFVDAGSVSGFLSDLPPDVWTDTGLILEQADVDQLVVGDPGPRLMEAFTVYENDAIKITGVRDYSAPAVPFTGSPNMDIFIMPGLDLFAGRSEAELGIVAMDVRVVLVWGPYVYNSFPREQLLNETHPHYGRESSGGWSYPGSPIDYAGAWDSMDFLNSVPNFRAIGFDSFTNTFGPEALPTGNFPRPPGYPPDPGSPPYLAGYFFQGIATVVYHGTSGLDGILLAVVIKSGTPYYIWGVFNP